MPTPCWSSSVVKHSTLTIALYIYFAAFRNGSLGYASVLSLILFFIPRF